MELILVRHGLPVRDETSADPPLSERGRAQSRLVSDWLAGEPIRALYASGMRRAQETAVPLAARLGLGCAIANGIEEFDRGSGRYIPLEELKAQDYAAWQAFVAGDHAVDIDAFQAQVVETIESLIRAHAGETIAVFCHGGVINVWTAHVLDMPARLFFEPDYTSIHRYLCARSGERNILALNERAHLRAGG